MQNTIKVERAIKNMTQADKRICILLVKQSCPSFYKKSL